MHSSYGVLESTARDPNVRTISGAGTAGRGSNKLLIDNYNSDQRDVVAVDNFAHEDYMVQADVDFNTRHTVVIWVRFTDVDNGYRITLENEGGTIQLQEFDKGTGSVVASGTHSATTTAAIKVKLSGASIKVWVAGTLEIDATDSTIPHGGVAFDGEYPTFDNLKIGYDNNSDNDIDP